MVLAIVLLETTNPGYFSGLLNITEDNASLNISTIIYWGILLLLSIGAYMKQWSLIPLLGLATCMYLLTGMTGNNWAWFGSWLALGLVLYFSYGYRKSRLAPIRIKVA